jgi:hypothetical protein
LALAAVGVVLLSPAPAYAASGHVPLVVAGIPVLSTLGGLVGGVFSGIGHAVLGAFTWTIGLATKFILTTIAALVKLLIPQSWVHKGLQIMQWIVAVPDYAGKVSSPGGGQEYGFAGINALRDVFTWLGVAIAPLTLVYATSRAMIGEGDPVGIPVLRIVAVSAVIVSYPYWWAQAAALADQITNTILAVPDVSRGLYKLMDYAVDGVALGGWQLIDLGLMGAIGLELIGLIFLKVVVILLGALLYATGPVTIGLVPTRAGSARPRLGQRGGRAAAARRRVGDAGRGRRAADRRLRDRRTADRRQQHAGEPRRWAAFGRRRPCQPVAVPQGRARGREPAAPAALRPARSRRPASSRWRDLRRYRTADDRSVAARVRLAARAGGRCRRGRARARRSGRRRHWPRWARRGLCRSPRTDRNSGGRRRSHRDSGRSLARGRGARALSRGCRRGPDGTRRHRQLANQGRRARCEATREPCRSRSRQGRGRDPPEPRSRTSRPAIHHRRRSDRPHTTQLSELSTIDDPPRQQPARRFVRPVRAQRQSAAVKLWSRGIAGARGAAR